MQISYKMNKDSIVTSHIYVQTCTEIRFNYSKTRQINVSQNNPNKCVPQDPNEYAWQDPNKCAQKI